jgi:hypothetical protein
MDGLNISARKLGGVYEQPPLESGRKEQVFPKAAELPPEPARGLKVRFWVTTQRPTESNPGGVIELGHYQTVGDGEVEVFDAHGKSVGRDVIGNRDVLWLARNLLSKNKPTPLRGPVNQRFV